MNEVKNIRDRGIHGSNASHQTAALKPWRKNPLLKQSGNIKNDKIINVKIDAKTKDEAKKVFESLGLTMSEAIRLFLIECVRHGKIPFDY